MAPSFILNGSVKGSFVMMETVSVNRRDLDQ